MRIEDFLNASQTNYTERLSQYKLGQAPTYQPQTGEEDRVTISAEARAAAQQSAEGQYSYGFTTGDGQSESSTVAAFKQYMEEARSPAGGSASTPEEKIKELEKQLAKLQNSLSEVASDPGLSDAAKTNRMNSLNSQINAVQAQISELSQQISESEA